MSDLISREAALKALSHMMDTHGFRDGWAVSRANVDCMLKSLPSAQLTDADIQKMQDVEQAMLEKAYECGKQDAAQWIPCSERLPKDDTLMLVNYINNRPSAGDIWIGWHEMENVWYIDGEEHSEERGNEVIAWMPLPEPYREVSEK